VYNGYFYRHCEIKCRILSQIISHISGHTGQFVNCNQSIIAIMNQFQDLFALKEKTNRPKWPFAF